jgi:hypothetical protein
MDTTYSQVQARRRAQAVRQDRENRHEYLDAYIETVVQVNAMRYDADGELEPFHADRDTLTLRAAAELVREAESFRRAQYTHLAAAVEQLQPRTIGNAWREMGACFALSASGHGAGFFDAGLADLGDTLQRAARVHGGQDLVRNDDGLLELL